MDKSVLSFSLAENARPRVRKVQTSGRSPAINDRFDPNHADMVGRPAHVSLYLIKIDCRYHLMTEIKWPRESHVEKGLPPGRVPRGKQGSVQLTLFEEGGEKGRRNLMSLARGVRWVGLEAMKEEEWRKQTMGASSQKGCDNEPVII